MSEQQIRDLLERRLEMWNTGNLAIADEIFASDYVSHESGEDQSGVEAFKMKPMRMREAFPDLRMTYSEIVIQGDRLAYYWTISGTHDGPLPGVEPTGKKVQFSGVVITRIEQGRFAEEWLQADIMGLMQQLGVVKAPDILAREEPRRGEQPPEQPQAPM